MKGAGGLLGEALRAARSQRVQSLLVALAVGAMCAAIVLTQGRVEGAREQVLSRIDGAGIRTVVVRADPDLRLSSQIVDVLDAFDDVEWVGAFGPAVDVANGDLPDGTKVALRSLWTSDPRALHLPALATGSTADQRAGGPPPIGRAWASSRALRTLGLPDGYGAVRSSDSSVDLAVLPGLSATESLAAFEPLLLAPQPADDPGTITTVVVVARSAASVGAVANAVRRTLSAQDPTKVAVSTDEDLASLHGEVGGDFGSIRASLTLAIMTVTALVVAGLLFALVMIRRKDFGRRRALGASQHWIVWFVLTQTSWVAGCGALCGLLGAAIALRATGDPLPGVGYFLAVGLVGLLVASLSAIGPAVIASRRDPLHELRVP